MIDTTKQYTYNGKPVRIYADGSDTYLNVSHGAVKDAEGWVVGSFPESELEEVWQPVAGEWCFFWDSVLHGLYIGKFMQQDKEVYIDITCTSWSNCAKFTGTLPESFKGL